MSELILDLDVGNSTTKWRLLGSEIGRFKNQDIERLKDLIGEEPDRIRIACVSSDVFKSSLSSILKDVFICEPEFAKSTAFCAGLKNGYEKPETLGVDRWLAGLAAWKQNCESPCLIIDAGSALTIDTIDDGGVFRGGYIIPGLVAMQQALTNNMGKVACSVENGIHESFLDVPTSTGRAVHWGACFAVIAIVEKAIDVFLLRWPRGTVRITGGNGEDIAVAVNKRDAYKAGLVLDGLALALP
jgi:type III pantothenate kinase